MMKRLLNKKGSVLFLVVVVMSILIVAASATFYIVNNQQSSVNVRYSSEQSYQTAVSVSDTVSKYIDGYLEAISKSGKDLSEFEDTIIGQMLNMKNPGKNIDITSKIDLSSINMGEANVNITYKGQRIDPTNSDNTIYTYDIKTTSEYNGETIVVTEVKEIILGPAEYFTRFLTSTGGRPEDVILQCGELFSDAYFENDYTAFGQENSKLHDSLYVSGTFNDTGMQYVKVKPTDKYEIVIGENFYITSAGGSGLDPESIFVGGNFINTPESNKAIKAKNVYVMGDLILDAKILDCKANFFINGNCTINVNTGENAIFYINKDLKIGSSVNGSMGTFYVKGDVELNGNIHAKKIKCDETKVTKNCTSCSSLNLENASSVIIEADITNALLNAKTADSSPVSTWTEVSEYIITNTKVNRYEDWDAEGYFNTDSVLSVSNTIDLTNAPNQVIWPEGVPNSGKQVFNDPNGYYSMSRYNKYDNNSGLVCEIKKSCKIVPITANWYNGDTLVFDATSSDLYIYLDSNGQTDSDGNKLFSFFTNTNATNVLVRGEHSVVFILPSDTNFKLNEQQFIGHEDLALYLSGMDNIDDLATNRKAVYCTNNEPTKSQIVPILKKIDPDTESPPTSSTKRTVTIMDQAVIGHSGNAHNNIFIVTNGKVRGTDGKLTSMLTNNYIDANAQASLCGFIYSPFSKMKSNGRSEGLRFFGGLIVGSYTYTNPSVMLIFTSPYDYKKSWSADEGGPIEAAKYKANDIVKYMIRFANGNGTVGDTNGIGPLQGYRTAGYK